MQADKIFTERKGIMEATFTFNQEANTQSLDIQLLNTQTSNKYLLTIDDEYIQTLDNYFKDNIESISELYEHLVREADRLNFSEDGALVFEIQVMIKKKVERKAYRLQGEKEKMSAIERINLQIEHIRKEMKIDSDKKDKRIFELEKKHNNTQGLDRQPIEALRKEMVDKISELSSQKSNDYQKVQTELRKVKEELRRNGQMIELSRREISHLVEEREVKNEPNIRQIRKQTERYAEGLARISQMVEQHENKIKEIIKITSKIEEDARRKLQLAINPDNPHRDSFAVKEQFNSLTIIKIRLDAWLSYFGATELEKGRVHSFRLKQRKTKCRAIFVGIGSRNTFGLQNAYKHRQALTYYSADGNVFEFGSFRKGGNVVNDGSVWSMVVDLSAFKMEWWIDNILQATANISSEMRYAPLYFLVQMFQVGDEVQLLL